MQKDNTTLAQKVALRLNLLRQIPDPVVLETHGGTGRVWFRCYRDVLQGLVIEKNSEKAELLARQRPTWSVYEGDCEKAIAAGAGRHLPINVVDVDPYGSPWPVIEAFFTSERPRPELLGLVVNDGLRHKLMTGGGWTMESMRPVMHYGTQGLYRHYLTACRELVDYHAGQSGYVIEQWAGYHCGRLSAMTHYAAVLRRTAT